MVDVAERETYRAIIEFVEAYVNGLYEMEVGELLGSMTLVADSPIKLQSETSMDPAAYAVWQDVFAKLSSRLANSPKT